MTDTPRAQLLGYLLQALEPEETEQIAEQLRRDPQLRHECLNLQRGLQLLAPDEEPFDPPLDLARRACRSIWRTLGTAENHSATAHDSASHPDRVSPLADDAAGLDLTGQTLSPLGVTYHSSLVDGTTPVVSRSGATPLSAGITDQVFRTNADARQPVELSRDYSYGNQRRWQPLDVGVAMGAMLFLGALILPAILQSRSQAQLANCQNNMREVFHGLSSLSAHHQGILPVAAERGPLAAAGVYAAKLNDAGYLSHPRLVLCPESDLARAKDFRIPKTAELLSAPPAILPKIQETMGGTYAFTLGYREAGKYHPVRNASRPHFALMSDLPKCTFIDGQLQYIGHHGGNGRNVLFEDGHILYLLDCRESPQGDHFYLNHSGEPQAGTNRNDAVLVGSGQGP